MEMPATTVPVRSHAKSQRKSWTEYLATREMPLTTASKFLKRPRGRMNSTETALDTKVKSPSSWHGLNVFEWLACGGLFLAIITFSALLIWIYFYEHSRLTTSRNTEGNVSEFAFFTELFSGALCLASLLGIRKSRWKRLVCLALLGILIS